MDLELNPLNEEGSPWMRVASMVLTIVLICLAIYMIVNKTYCDTHIECKMDETGYFSYVMKGEKVCGLMTAEGPIKENCSDVMFS